MNPSSNMKAVLVLAEHKHLNKLITPALNIERDSINWDYFGYHGQSHGVQAALSWAYCLFCDEVPPVDWNYRDPFGAFFSMDRSLQEVALKAMAIRHGFVSMTLEDRPKSDFEHFVEKFSEKMAEEERRRGLKIVDSPYHNGLLGDLQSTLRKANHGLVISKHDIEDFKKRYQRGELNGEELEVHSKFQTMLQELEVFVKL
jgi:hypothetical protein